MSSWNLAGPPPGWTASPRFASSPRDLRPPPPARRAEGTVTILPGRSRSSDRPRRHTLPAHTIPHNPHVPLKHVDDAHPTARTVPILKEYVSNAHRRRGRAPSAGFACDNRSWGGRGSAPSGRDDRGGGRKPPSSYEYGSPRPSPSPMNWGGMTTVTGRPLQQPRRDSGDWMFAPAAAGRPADAAGRARPRNDSDAR